MADDEFQNHEAKAGAGLDQPEGGRGQRFVEAAEPANEPVRGEERLASTQLLAGRKLRG
jgi:hypothetical protein